MNLRELQEPIDPRVLMAGLKTLTVGERGKMRRSACDRRRCAAERFGCQAAIDASCPLAAGAAPQAHLKAGARWARCR